MKRVLVLGAGLVSRPMVRYLLDVPDFEVIVATRTVSKARELVAANPRGKAIPLLVDDDAALGRLVGECDLAVSLLPYTYHVKVANHCLKHVPERNRAGPGHRPHVGDEDHPRRAEGRRQGGELHVLLRRPARARGE
jgi:hypothetical protein